VADLPKEDDMTTSFAANLQPLHHHAIIKLAPRSLIDAKAQVRNQAPRKQIDYPTATGSRASPAEAVRNNKSPRPRPR
jgi:hypothetical protein